MILLRISTGNNRRGFAHFARQLGIGERMSETHGDGVVERYSVDGTLRVVEVPERHVSPREDDHPIVLQVGSEHGTSQLNGGGNSAGERESAATGRCGGSAATRDSPRDRARPAAAVRNPRKDAAAAAAAARRRRLPRCQKSGEFTRLMSGIRR